MTTAFCFDVDGTVTTAELLPSIASELGVADEIATLTRATMDGLIPFEQSFRLRYLILRQIPPERVRAVVASIPLDEHIVAFIQARPAECFLVTGNLDTWIEPIAVRLGCGLYSSRASRDTHCPEIEHILDKGHAVSHIRARAPFDRVVAIGDGANDITMMSAADIAIAFGGVHPPAGGTVLAADYVVNSGKALCTLLNAL